MRAGMLACRVQYLRLQMAQNQMKRISLIQPPSSQDAEDRIENSLAVHLMKRQLTRVSLTYEYVEQGLGFESSASLSRSSLKPIRPYTDMTSTLSRFDWVLKIIAPSLTSSETSQ